ncbi:hypothetical protein [Nocardioides lijunqiniae]|uniref:hypothetical protein n=1 Tax=Nocardioides lijunqiniae TaxID=2760832 RepID=UPI001877FC06|nr:hypothetical protein [Nocardioides lijunqiniae]
MELDGSWHDLVAALDDWTAASALSDRTIDVALPSDDGPGRRLMVVLTPDEWEDMTDVMWGSFEAAVEEVKQTLREMGADDAFAVYSQYRLVPSVSPTVGEEGGWAAPSGPGEWVASDSEGRS